MARRSSRRDTLLETDKRRLLDALAACRQAVMESHRHLNYCPTYRLGGAVADAIDDLAEELTGDRKLFWAGSSTGPNR